jgi:Tfp pilus assembly PilM family ATPase
MALSLKDLTNTGVSLLGCVAKWSPIGVDIGDDAVKMVQLSNNAKTVSLIAAGSKNQPENVKGGSWQRWAVEAISELTANGKFRGKEIIAAMPAGDVFIDHIRIPRIKDSTLSDDKIRDIVFSKIKQKLPFESGDAMIRYIPAEGNNAMVIAAERKIIDRHLAIYENANMKVKSIGVWPMALVSTYTRFFGRRKADIDAIVMLLEMDANHTNVVICRHKDPLFARSISMGAKHLGSGEMVARLVLELNGCKRHFRSMYKNAQMERLIFLSGQSRDTNVCSTIAKQLEMPAQVGDCLAAVKITDPYRLGIDRRDCQVNWATAFGLGLS